MPQTPRTRRPLRRTKAACLGWLFIVLCLACGAASAQESPERDAGARIRDAALNHSQIMDTVGYLADVIGPRLTGSPNLK
jgi:hypothetical protein